MDDVDLYIGGLSEVAMEDAYVGPTFGCIIGGVFKNLKIGDRFWFEHENNPGAFTPGKLLY